MPGWLRRVWPVVLTLGFGLGGVYAWEQHALLAPGPLAADRTVFIPRAASAAVAASLDRAGVIDSPLLFRLAAFQTRSEGALHAGRFPFPAHVSLRDALTILRAPPAPVPGTSGQAI